jgi:Fe2+ or Zn2+ uptake regulation protein
MLSGVRSAGLKLTPQRVAIIRAFADDPTHPTAQEIFDRLQSSMPTMSFATVYNTLDALTSAGLAGSLSLSPGPARFDPNMELHDHAVCDGCGLVRDVPRGAPRTSLPRATSGSLSRATSGSLSRATSGSLPRATSGSLPRATSGSLPRATSGSLPRATSTTTGTSPGETAAVPGFEVRAVEHIYRGLCAACAGGAAEGSAPPPPPSSPFRHQRRHT